MNWKVIILVIKVNINIRRKIIYTRNNVTSIIGRSNSQANKMVVGKAVRERGGQSFTRQKRSHEPTVVFKFNVILTNGLHIISITILNSILILFN